MSLVKFLWEKKNVYREICCQVRMGNLQQSFFTAPQFYQWPNISKCFHTRLSKMQNGFARAKALFSKTCLFKQCYIFQNLPNRTKFYQTCPLVLCISWKSVLFCYDMQRILNSSGRHWLTISVVETGLLLLCLFAYLSHPGPQSSSSLFSWLTFRTWMLTRHWPSTF